MPESMSNERESRESKAVHTRIELDPIRLRLWPAIVVIALMWTALTVPGWLAHGTLVEFFSMVFGPLISAVAVIIWWLFGSGARWNDRWMVLGVVVAAGAAVAFFSHPSIFIHLILFGVPVIVTLWVTWLALTQSMKMNWSARMLGLLAVVLAGFSYFLLIRVDGADGDIRVTTSWRWSPTTEQDFLASRERDLTISGAQDARAIKEFATEGESTTAPLTLDAGDWPEFRGPNRDNRLDEVRINDDWSKNPPKLIWKQKLGPGWGAFTVIGDRLFTQEQRGEEEAVVCYRATDGAELWIHQDKTRFWETIGGAGPRATPTFRDGKLYTTGANGRLNCLDAATGRRLWGVDMIESGAVKVPDWGYASSPLVVGDSVYVLPGRPDGGAVQAYDRDTGKRLWSSGQGTHSYSSPQWATIDGIEQIVAETNQGMSGLDPSTGRVLWNHAWPTPGDGARVLQPVVDGNAVYLNTYFGMGMRRLRVTRQGEEWQVAIDWESRELKPYFNDSVILDGHAYGFDVNIFCCIDLQTGKRSWKGGRYGYGQVLLIADQKLLLVISETGEAILLKADPQKQTELGRFTALEGKTWNHPVIVRGKLYVRNAQEMACYDVSPGENVAAK